MQMPAFSGEASLYKSTNRYTRGGDSLPFGRSRAELAAFIRHRELTPCPLGCSEVCREVCGPGGQCTVNCDCIC